MTFRKSPRGTESVLEKRTTSKTRLGQAERTECQAERDRGCDTISIGYGWGEDEGTELPREEIDLTGTERPSLRV